MDERLRLVEWLEIENFRGIRQAQLPFSALTVLVGLNGSGKTTILEALYLASAYPVGTSVRRIQSEEHDPAGRSPILYVLQRHAYKGAKQRAPDAEISRRSDPAGSWKADEGRENQRSQPEGSSGEAGDSPQDREWVIHTAELRIRDPRWLIYAGQDQACIRIRSPATTLSLEDWDKSRQAVLIDPFAGVDLEEGIWFPRDPVDPSLSREPIALIRGRDEWVVEGLRKVYPDLPIRRLAGGPGGGERPHTVWAVIGDQPIAIENLGDGIQAAFRALSLLALMETGLFLWDEPEDHQHPDALVRLVDVLVDTLRQRPGLQAVIATQSREVLDAVRKIASRDETKGQWLQQAFTLLFLILNVEDGRLYAERFNFEEFMTFEELDVDLRKLWMGRRVPAPRRIPPEFLDRLIERLHKNPLA